METIRDCLYVSKRKCMASGTILYLLKTLGWWRERSWRRRGSGPWPQSPALASKQNWPALKGSPDRPLCLKRSLLSHEACLVSLLAGIDMFLVNIFRNSASGQLMQEPNVGWKPIMEKSPWVYTETSWYVNENIYISLGGTHYYWNSLSFPQPQGGLCPTVRRWLKSGRVRSDLVWTGQSLELFYCYYYPYVCAGNSPGE